MPVLCRHLVVWDAALQPTPVSADGMSTGRVGDKTSAPLSLWATQSARLKKWVLGDGVRCRTRPRGPRTLPPPAPTPCSGADGQGILAYARMDTGARRGLTGSCASHRPRRRLPRVAPRAPLPQPEEVPLPRARPAPRPREAAFWLFTMVHVFTRGCESPVVSCAGPAWAGRPALVQMPHKSWRRWWCRACQSRPPRGRPCSQKTRRRPSRPRPRH